MIPRPGVSRNVHALLARPHLRLTRAGLKLRCWKPAGFLRMFLPTYRMVDVSIPWPDYQGCQTYTHTINSIPNWRSLTLRTASGHHELGWDVCEIFGAMPRVPEARYDAQGLVWLMRGFRVLDLDIKGATIAATRGGRVRFYRRPASDLRPPPSTPAWNLPAPSVAPP